MPCTSWRTRERGAVLVRCICVKSRRTEERERDGRHETEEKIKLCSACVDGGCVCCVGVGVFFACRTVRAESALVYIFHNDITNVFAELN